MTQTVTPVATPPVVRALLDQAREKNYRAGVLGVRARPEWDGPAEFDHHGVPVRVEPCGSALAVREALLDRSSRTWLVVLTDRDESDLGYGLLGRFLWHRLRTPDPWDAVRQRFAASGIDPALTAEEQHRDVATGLLAATPPDGWPPAPGGVLTREHAFAALARTHLGLGSDGLDIDTAAVLAWSARADTAAVADLRALAGDAVCDAALRWVAGKTGAGHRPLERLLASGAAADAVPLGLVAGLLVAARNGDGGGEAAQIARDAMIRLEHTLGSAARDDAALAGWGTQAEAVAADLLHDRDDTAAGKQVVARADALLRAVDAQPLAAASDLLPAGLSTRLARLADALRVAAGRADARTAVAGALVADADLCTVEAAWGAVVAHRLADTDRRVPPLHAAVRLARWLATDTAVKPGLAAAVDRHRDADAWVDRAAADATTGVGDPDLGAALGRILEVVRRRRDAHDREFAAALAAHTRDDPAADAVSGQRTYRGVRHLEDLLPDVVVPLARQAPTLLLVMDGMSVAVAAEVMAVILGLDRVADGWAEVLLPGEDRRAAALAVLPTITEVSRASLLCGELRSGGRDAEGRGYAELVRAHGSASAVLFHKAALDTSQPGHDLASDVAVAIDDVERRPLVTCVLNAIDDALDRSDPGGTDWGPDAVKHLDPLLDRARRAGRVVVLTADHGHVVERRAGRQRPYPEISSARSRPGDGHGPGDDEVSVAGRRVLRHDGRAVLAVDERLRYGPLKAGYHGGAAPAEAVVPVCVLVPGALPEGADLRLAGPQEPPWWTGPAGRAAGTRTAGTRAAGTPGAPGGPAAGPGAPGGPTPPAPPAPPAEPADAPEAPMLFDMGEPASPGSAAASPAGSAAASPAGGAAASPESSAEDSGEPNHAEAVADAVVGSAPYREQRRIAGRVAVGDARVRALLAALLAAADHRLASHRVAAALQVPQTAVRGALAHVFRLVNVEGYPVVAFDADGVTVVLDEALLREQFGVRP